MLLSAAAPHRSRANARPKTGTSSRRPSASARFGTRSGRFWLDGQASEQVGGTLRFHRETDHGDFALWLTLAAVPLPHPVNPEKYRLTRFNAGVDPRDCRAWVRMPPPVDQPLFLLLYKHQDRGAEQSRLSAQSRVLNADCQRSVSVRPEAAGFWAASSYLLAALSKAIHVSMLSAANQLRRRSGCPHACQVS